MFDATSATDPESSRISDSNYYRYIIAVVDFSKIILMIFTRRCRVVIWIVNVLNAKYC
jgi:hypothetical protein